MNDLRLAERVSKRLKTEDLRKSENVRKISKLHWTIV